jgi:hypothetical protein
MKIKTIKLGLDTLGQGFYSLNPRWGDFGYPGDLPIRDYLRFDWDHGFAGWSQRGIPLSSKVVTDNLLFGGASWLGKAANDGCDPIPTGDLGCLIFVKDEIEVYFAGEPDQDGPKFVVVPRHSYLPYDPGCVRSYPSGYSLSGYRGDRLAWVEKVRSRLKIWQNRGDVHFSGRLKESEWLEAGYVFDGDKYVCDCSERSKDGIFIPCRHVREFRSEFGLDRPGKFELSYDRDRKGYLARRIVIKDRAKASKLLPWITRMPKLKRIFSTYGGGDYVPLTDVADCDYMAADILICDDKAKIDPLLLRPDKGRAVVMGNRIVVRTRSDLEHAARTVRDVSKELHVPERFRKLRACVGGVDLRGDLYILKAAVASLTTKAGREDRHKRLQERFGSVPANWEVISDATFEEHQQILEDLAAGRIRPLAGVDFKELKFLGHHLEPLVIDPSITVRKDPLDGMSYYPPALDLGPKLLKNEKAIHDLLMELDGKEKLLFLVWLAKRCEGNDWLLLLASILKREYGFKYHESMQL